MGDLTSTDLEYNLNMHYPASVLAKDAMHKYLMRFSLPVESRDKIIKILEGGMKMAYSEGAMDVLNDLYSVSVKRPTYSALNFVDDNSER